MIDTLRYRFELTQNQYDRVRRKAVELEQRDNSTDRTIFRVLREDLPLGSYDRRVNLFINDDRMCFLEFSAPKYAIGHNVFLLPPEEIPELLEKLCDKLVKLFGDFPRPIFWELMRVDLCYAWKLRNHDVAAKVLSVLQKLEVPRKKKAVYASSVMFLGHTMSLKFYLKDDEFYAHDFKEFKKMGLNELAYNTYQIAQGVIRFEITIRKKHLNSIFPEGKIFDTKTCEHVLRRYLKQVIGCKGEAMTLDAVAERLLERYGKTMGFHLYAFYRTYYEEFNGKSKLKSLLSRSQEYRNRQRLKQAGVGISTSALDLKPTDFDLSIPSIDVVNGFAASPPGRGARVR